MTDIALIWDNVNGRADFAIVDGDLVMDEGLRTPVILSLFCDRLADPSDVIPDGGDDRRCWWGDTPAAGGLDGNGIDLSGSHLWLYMRTLQTAEVALKIRDAALRSLAWMREDGIADSIAATVTYSRLGVAILAITLRQGNVSHTYDFPWSMS